MIWGATMATRGGRIERASWGLAVVLGLAGCPVADDGMAGDGSGSSDGGSTGSGSSGGVSGSGAGPSGADSSDTATRFPARNHSWTGVNGVRPPSSWYGSGRFRSNTAFTAWPRSAAA